MNKIEVVERLEHLGTLEHDFFEGRISKSSILNFPKYLNELYEKRKDHAWTHWDENNLPSHPSKFFDFKIELESGWEDDRYYVIYGIRLETDEEYNKRIIKEKEAIEKAKKSKIIREAKRIEKEKEKEVEEKLLYEKLKQKYEK